MTDNKYERLFTEKDVRGLILLALTHPAVADPYGVADAVMSGEFGAQKLTFPADEPLFLLRGQDRAAVPAIRDYGHRADEAGAGAVHLGYVSVAALKMETWQRANPDRTKVPD